MNVNHHHGMGWLPDYPDLRDYNPGHEKIKPLLKKANAAAPLKTLPTSVDLRPWCSPIEDQETIGSCTAHAGVGVYEYFERRAFGKHIDASRLFLYKVTRTMAHLTGDTGAFLRSTMGAMVLFGVPPEEFWPYNPDDFEKEPPSFSYAFAQNYQALNYYRLDPPTTAKKEVLERVKTNLTAGLPSMFGFTVYDSIHQVSNNGEIPYPTAGEHIVGGHAVDAVGYDDSKKIKNTSPQGSQTTGALLIRNSWGTGWGEQGYGWLPYDYVLKGLAQDWWSLIKGEWVDTGEFKA
jgi:C1A family cysteine protease